MGRILQDAEIEVLRKCRELCVAAVKDAAPKIAKDFKKKVFDQAVQDYYDDYEPTRYKRLESLYNAFYTNYSIGSDSESISIKGGWDYRRLPDHQSGSQYHQDGDEWISRFSSAGKRKIDEGDEDLGTPENGWILTNFMEGIHPRYIYNKSLDMSFNVSYSFEPSYLRIKCNKERYQSSGSAQQILLKSLKKQVKNK